MVIIIGRHGGLDDSLDRIIAGCFSIFLGKVTRQKGVSANGTVTCISDFVILKFGPSLVPSRFRNLVGARDGARA